jgi:O-antigen/teichoic acid export membrane protein
MAETKYAGAALILRLRAYYGLKLFTLLTAFLFQILVAKVLSPESFATYAILLATLIAAERIFSFGLDRTLLRYVPPLTSHADYVSLRKLLVGTGAVRLVSVLAVLTTTFLASDFLQSHLPTSITPQTIYAYAAWYIGFALTTDAEVLAQSWHAHVQVATIAAFEILARCLGVLCYAWTGLADPDSIITVCAITSVSSLGVSISVGGWMLCNQKGIEKLASDAAARYPGVKVETAPMFAASVYASNLSWLISSPVVIRLLSKNGLPLLAFSAFSFIQGLSVSLQRGLPGQMVVPSLEPLLAKYGSGEHKQRMFAILSLVFKVELVLSLSLIVITTLMGEELVAFLSHPAYATYFFVLPWLTMALLLQTAYRICETVMSIHLKNRAFLLFWPIALLSVFLIYLTVDRWGLWSIIIVPIGEGVLRIVALFAIYRREEIWRAFDLPRSFQLVLSAGLALAIGDQVAKGVVHTWSIDASLTFATFLLWVLFLFAIRPLNATEVDALAAVTPKSMGAITRIAISLSRP